MSKQSSVEQIFSHIKASRNDIQYWNDSMLVDWLLEQEDRLKAIHKDEIVDAYCKAGLDIAHNDSIKESGLAQEYYIEAYGGDDE